MVDYIRVTFKTHDVDHIIENILHLNKDFMTEKPNGFYGYVGTFELDFIKVFTLRPEIIEVFWSSYRVKAVDNLSRS